MQFTDRDAPLPSVLQHPDCQEALYKVNFQVLFDWDQMFSTLAAYLEGDASSGPSSCLAVSGVATTRLELK